MIDNVSLIRGKHTLKTGIDAQWIGDERVRGELFLYTFATINDYLAAKSGDQSRSATRTSSSSSVTSRPATIRRFYGMFVQDDWQIAPRLKLLYGLRYDLFDVPEARQFAANPYSQNFAIDKNNFGPRAGLSWSVDNSARTVVRASIGLMYEPPLLDFYDNAILNNGDPKSYNVGPVCRTAAGAPAFPSSLATPPPGFVLPKTEHQRGRPGLRDAVGVAEQRPARTCAQQRLSPSRVGYVNSIGRNLPGADGRQPGRVRRDARRRPAGVLGRARVDPTFDHINVFQSIARIDLQRLHRHADQADDARVDDAGDLHARPRRGQRAPDRHLRGRQRRRPRVRSRRTSIATGA